MPETTILLADDHPRMLASARSLLEDDFEVVGAVSNGAALIAAALELEPRVIVTDLVMGQVNGLEAAKAILERSSPKPLIVMLTAFSDEETAREARAAGILGFVSKTRLADDLVHAIRTCLAGSQFVSPMSGPSA